MEINFDEYEHILIGLSGGKDSTAVALYMRFKSGIAPERLTYVFCDTENEDPLTYAYLDMLKEHLAPSKFVVLDTIGFFQLAKQKKRFPSPKARFCTMDLKVIPSIAYTTKLAENGKVLSVNGIRKSEGTIHNDRGNLKIFEESLSFVNVDIYRPVYDFTIQGILDLTKELLPLDKVIDIVENDRELTREHKNKIINEMRRTGYSLNPLYFMGAVRVGCFPCIMSRKKEIQAISIFRPERIAELKEWEQEINSTFFSRNTVPSRYRDLVVSERPKASGGMFRKKAASIEAVVKWSKTSWGAKEIEELDLEEIITCDLLETGLACE